MIVWTSRDTDIRRMFIATAPNHTPTANRHDDIAVPIAILKVNKYSKHDQLLRASTSGNFHGKNDDEGGECPRGIAHRL